MKNYIITKILNKLNSSGIIKEEDFVYYRYGFTTAFEFISVQLICIIWACMQHQLLEYVIFYFSFITLRRFAGGFHFKDFLPCFITSILSIITVMKITQSLTSSPLTSLLICLATLGVIGLLAPVPTVSEHWDAEEISVRRRKMLRILLIFAGLSALLYVINIPRWLHLFMVTFVFMILILIAGRLRYSYYQRKELRAGLSI